jgi:hypothetical protein
MSKETNKIALISGEDFKDITKDGQTVRIREHCLMYLGSIYFLLTICLLRYFF